MHISHILYAAAGWLFRFDLVAWICGGQASVVARVIYTLVGLAAIWCISLLFRGRDEIDGDTEEA